MLKNFLVSKIPNILKKSDRIEELDIFKKFKFRNFEKYKIGEKDSKIKLFVPLPVTSSGKIQKECPNKDCFSRLFYIDNLEMLKKKQSVISTDYTQRSSSIINCPSCGYKSNNKEFISQQDKQHILQTVIWAFYEDMKDIFCKLFRDSKSSGKIARMFTSEYIYKNLDNQIKNKGSIQSVFIKFVKAFYTVMHEKNIKPKNRYLTLNKKVLLYLEKPIEREKSLADFKFQLTIENSVENLLESKKYQFNPSDINPKIKIGIFDDIIVNGESVGSVGISVPIKPDKPKIYREDLLRNIKCPFCSQEYGVYAIAFFCPNCGSQNLTAHFQKEKELIKKQINRTHALKERDKEFYYRLLGNAHEDILTSFETYLKNIFYFIAEVKNIIQDKTKTKVFQNLGKIEKFYQEINIDPFILITNDEKEKLKRYIEIRHVIGHNLSITDEKFVSKFSNYSEGMNVSISENEVLEFVMICEKVVVFLEQTIKGMKLSMKKISPSSSEDEWSDLLELIKYVHTVNKKSHLEQDKKN